MCFDCCENLVYDDKNHKLTSYQMIWLIRLFAIRPWLMTDKNVNDVGHHSPASWPTLQTMYFAPVQSFRFQKHKKCDTGVDFIVWEDWEVFHNREEEVMKMVSWGIFSRLWWCRLLMLCEAFENIFVEVSMDGGCDKRSWEDRWEGQRQWEYCEFREFLGWSTLVRCTMGGREVTKSLTGIFLLISQ